MEITMNERLKFIEGQKKRLLNQISSKVAEFKMNGKNLGVFLTIEEDGHLKKPRDFEDLDLPVLNTEFSKLTTKEKRAYDKKYYSSVSFVIDSYNEANKKYNAIFEELDVYEKMDTIKEEISALKLEEKRADIYLATLSKQSEEKLCEKLGSKKKLTEQQILEVNEEITQVNYIKASLNLKTSLLNNLKISL
jgi:hypothetical protein